MKPITQKILIGCIITLAIILAFGGGFYYGIDFAHKIYKPSDETELCMRTMLAQTTIEKLDEDKILETHSAILSRLNGDIMAIDLSLETVDDEDVKNKMHHLLSRIAKHREKFPQYYKEFENKTPQFQEASLKVAEILKKYRK